ncbi:hypothetical protein EVAR_7886_1 [Eumeta japonica]|uniref:Uncharacterized protein n=1 Tax=Eumeta variegata TaxID=151549 RepID=A0A4C1TV28_EUMVA|nr:hypothetical protein EVAR_7886_1 [Eumeta japonica]
MECGPCAAAAGRAAPRLIKPPPPLPVPTPSAPWNEPNLYHATASPLPTFGGGPPRERPRDAKKRAFACPARDEELSTTDDPLVLYRCRRLFHFDNDFFFFIVLITSPPLPNLPSGVFFVRHSTKPYQLLIDCAMIVLNCSLGRVVDDSPALGQGSVSWAAADEAPPVAHLNYGIYFK